MPGTEPTLPMAYYLDDTQRETLYRLRATWTWRVQWPTWLLIFAIYGGWYEVATHVRTLGLPLATALLAVFGAWYMSLQHELLHGHPTRSATFNALLGLAPLAVWFPYGIYRASHLAHHNDHHLTHPEHDPESWFVSAHIWQQGGVIQRTLFIVRNTFAGRLLIGPAFSIAAALSAAVRKLVTGDIFDMSIWVAHSAAVIALAWWLDHACGLPAWAFLIAGYAALSIGSVRSFYEHRAVDASEQRSVINEAGWFWRLLFLNNNYHAVHHDLPCVPWFALRSVYEASRQQYIARSGGFLVNGYGEWLRRYTFAPVAHPVHEHSSAFSQWNAAASRAGRRNHVPPLDSSASANITTS